MSVWPWSCYRGFTCKTAKGGFVFRLKAYATVMRAESENRAWQTKALGTRHLWTSSIVLSPPQIQILDWQTDTVDSLYTDTGDTKLWERDRWTQICIEIGTIFRFWPMFNFQAESAIWSMNNLWEVSPLHCEMWNFLRYSSWYAIYK